MSGVGVGLRPWGVRMRGYARQERGGLFYCRVAGGIEIWVTGRVTRH